MKLKLHRERVMVEREPTERDRMKFPVFAVRAMPAPGRHQEAHMPTDHRRDDVLSHSDVVRNIEATLDRVQATMDRLHEQVDSFKFPGARVNDADRPRAA